MKILKFMRLFFCLLCLAARIGASAQADETNAVRAVILAAPDGRVVGTNAMQRIYDEVKTPFKYGVVLKGDGTNEFVDCPSIFHSGGHWYMMYVAITNKVGYQTFLARSDDLLHWEKLGKILSFSETGWDAKSKTIRVYSVEHRSRARHPNHPGRAGIARPGAHANRADDVASAARSGDYSDGITFARESLGPAGK